MRPRKLIHGVGINDSNYPTQRKETVSWVDGKQTQRLLWTCPYFQLWNSLMQRCYSERHKLQRPTYRDASCCEEWNTFSNFRRWMETQDWQEKELDKDLILPGNKHYSPETCAFVSKKTNNFLTDHGRARGDYPIGVHAKPGYRKLVGQCCNPYTGKITHLGYFDTAEQAHQAWRAEKHRIALLLAEEQSDSRVAAALRVRFLNTTSTEGKDEHCGDHCTAFDQIEDFTEGEDHAPTLD